MNSFSSKNIVLNFGTKQKCQIVVGDGATNEIEKLWHSNWHNAAIIGDSNVISLYGEALERKLKQFIQNVIVLDFPYGEAHKVRGTKEILEDHLLAQGFGRQTCVVALGGGISLDIAGFVAATYMRGVACIYIPTSLLAQVDAAIGGKTGINTEHGKNLIGVLSQPVCVIVDSEYLKTLPQKEWTNGLAEIVKHAVIADAELFEWIENNVNTIKQPGKINEYVLRRCIEIKGEIVQQDEHEEKKRAWLNFGHTIGHAIEASSNFKVSHGQAVAIGMGIEGSIACELCGFPKKDLQRLNKCLSVLDFDSNIQNISFDALIPFLKIDKKRKDKQLYMALPVKIGNMFEDSGEFIFSVPIEIAKKAWEHGL